MRHRIIEPDLPQHQIEQDDENNEVQLQRENEDIDGAEDEVIPVADKVEIIEIFSDDEDLCPPDTKEAILPQVKVENCDITAIDKLLIDRASQHTTATSRRNNIDAPGPSSEVLTQAPFISQVIGTPTVSQNAVSAESLDARVLVEANSNLAASSSNGSHAGTMAKAADRLPLEKIPDVVILADNVQHVQTKNGGQSCKEEEDFIENILPKAIVAKIEPDDFSGGMPFISNVSLNAVKCR